MIPKFCEGGVRLRGQDAKLYRTGGGTEAKLAFPCHSSMEKRPSLLAGILRPPIAMPDVLALERVPIKWSHLIDKDAA